MNGSLDLGKFLREQKLDLLSPTKTGGRPMFLCRYIILKMRYNPYVNKALFTFRYPKYWILFDNYLYFHDSRVQYIYIYKTQQSSFART